MEVLSSLKLEDNGSNKQNSEGFQWCPTRLDRQVGRQEVHSSAHLLAAMTQSMPKPEMPLSHRTNPSSARKLRLRKQCRASKSNDCDPGTMGFKRDAENGGCV
jgi:hypothetical protein